MARGGEPALDLGAEPGHYHAGRLDVEPHALLGKVERHLEACDEVDELVP